MVAPQQALQNPQQTRDFLGLLICHSPLQKIKWKGEKTASRSPWKPPENTCLCWQGVVDKGENLKNSQHLVLIDLQLVVQIFVSFKPYAKESLNLDCTFLIQYKHLLVQSWTYLKRNKISCNQQWISILTWDMHVLGTRDPAIPKRDLFSALVEFAF